MCANKSPKNYCFIFNGSRDIQQTSTLGLTDPSRVLVLQTEREFRRVEKFTLNFGTDSLEEKIDGSQIWNDDKTIQLDMTI